MGKMTNALKKVQQDRASKVKSLMKEDDQPLRRSQMSQRGGIQNLPLMWIFLVIVVVTVLFAFNYQGGKETIPLSEIFPNEEVFPIDVEYEYIDGEQFDGKEKIAETNAVVKKTVAIEKELPLQKEAKKETVVPTVMQQSLPSQKISSSSGIDLKTDPKMISFAIQVASFKKRAWAETEVERLKEKGFEGYILSRDLGEKGVWYRVYVGKFKTHQDAKNYLSKVQAEYKNSFIISPSAN